MEFMTDFKDDSLCRIRDIGTAIRDMAKAVNKVDSSMTYREMYVIMDTPLRMFALALGYAGYHGISERAARTALSDGIGSELMSKFSTDPNIALENASTEEFEPIKDDLGLWGAASREMALDTIVTGMVNIKGLEQFNQRAQNEGVQYIIDLMKVHENFIRSTCEISQEDVDLHIERRKDTYLFLDDDEEAIVLSELNVLLQHGAFCKSELQPMSPKTTTDEETSIEEA